MMDYLGEIAAIATSFLFAGSSTVNTLAGRVVGSIALNRLRLALAILLLVLTHILLRIPLPLYAGPQRWLWLSLSGILGLAIGDAFLFQAFIWIGARLSMLLLALSPAMAGVLAWIFLGEILSIGQWAGIVLTLFGIGGVILDRNGTSRQEASDRKHYLIGIIFGLGAAAGQALGQVTAKRGLYGDFSPVSGTLIRMLAAAVVIWGIAIFQRQAIKTMRLMIDRRQAAWWIIIGSILGPFLGVTFLLYAVQTTPVGIASTLSSLSPIVLLPVGYFFFKERFGWQSILGTLLALAGTAIFFLV
ncbi:MAG: putative rane protein [Chloroflexi bacterium]|jgi:drug/metabolite transporter (DMT)-like permease|nr:putative rane protein [Chloroflexota bacterium]